MRSRSKLLPALALITLGLGCEQPAEPAMAASRTGLYVEPSYLWSQDSIEVCWSGGGTALERAWLRQAIESSWEQVINVDFTNWGVCESYPVPEPVRIEVNIDDTGESR